MAHFNTHSIDSLGLSNVYLDNSLFDEFHDNYDDIHNFTFINDGGDTDRLNYGIDYMLQ